LLLGCARGERGGSEHEPQGEGNHPGHFKPPKRPVCRPKGRHTRCLIFTAPRPRRRPNTTAPVSLPW
jgi:hypothetical protein